MTLRLSVVFNVSMFLFTKTFVLFHGCLITTAAGEEVVVAVAVVVAVVVAVAVAVVLKEELKEANAEKAEFALGGGDILSSIMPIFSKLQGLAGGDGQSGGIMNIFSSLLGGSSGGSGVSGGGAGIGGLLQQGGLGNFQGLFANAFSALSEGGCSGGSCSGVSGNCSGGNCSNCPNGSCGGSSGSSYTG